MKEIYYKIIFTNNIGEDKKQCGDKYYDFEAVCDDAKMMATSFWHSAEMPLYVSSDDEIHYFYVDRYVDGDYWDTVDHFPVQKAMGERYEI
jgi:hypothetical protein